MIVHILDFSHMHCADYRRYTTHNNSVVAIANTNRDIMKCLSP